MFLAGRSDRRAEHIGDAAVEVWCETAVSVRQAAATTAHRTSGTAASTLEADSPSYATYAANRAAWRALCSDEGGPLPPPLLRDPSTECPGLNVPFVTDKCGAMPVLPNGLEQTLAAYLPEDQAAPAEAPDVSVDGSGKCAASWLRRRGAREALREAEESGRRYWAALACDELRQPPWWPAAACGTGGVGPGRGSVPSYEQVIVGRGATGIGMHADAYGLGEARRLVSTCLTICRGCKRVLLLPPCCAQPGAPTTLGDAWRDELECFPLAPPPALLRRIAAAGGFLFSLRPLSEAEGRGLALFLPAGWLHWLVGGGGNESAAAVEDEQSARDHGHGWHALFGGSFFPRAGPREAEGHESPQRDQTDAS